MKIFLFLFLISSTAYAQKSHFTIGSCTIMTADGKKDTVFNATQGNVFCIMDLDSMKLKFDWQTKDIKTVKTYKILEKRDIKEPDYNTMGVYAMKLRCVNRSGGKATADFALNTRLNNIQIVVTDGEHVLFYEAVQTK